jgi:DNA-3-methyladenine glycosylase II
MLESRRYDEIAGNMIFDATTHSKTESPLRIATQELAVSDPTLGVIIRRIGPCRHGMARRNRYFASLVEAIIHQQLGGKAAGAILTRFRSLYPSRRFPTPEEILGTPESQLRGSGLSPQKITYVKDLASRMLDGSIRLRGLSSMKDEEVISHLTQVKGIGRWTAEMFLIFTLGRPDVLPLNDLGILKAVRKAYGLGRMPSAQTLERMGRKWQPYRSVAAWYLWASVDESNAAQSQ